jgi:hypothetical protein
VKQFHTLLCIKEYELQFCSHDDVEQTWAKIHLTMGANVRTPTPIKSHHLWGSIFNKVAIRMSANGP